jgi:hypothetical protein
MAQKVISPSRLEHQGIYVLQLLRVIITRASLPIWQYQAVMQLIGIQYTNIDH